MQRDILNRIPLHGEVHLFIDAENAQQLKYIKQIIKLAEYNGKLKTCCAYGDWTNPSLSPQQEKVEALKIECVQVDNIGKNSADHRLLLEIGAILGPYGISTFMDVFIIASGDGGFSSACKPLQESSNEVIGIGSEKSSSPDLQKACDKFYFLEDLDYELAKLEKCHPILQAKCGNCLMIYFLPITNLTRTKMIGCLFPPLVNNCATKMPLSQRNLANISYRNG